MTGDLAEGPGRSTAGDPGAEAAEAEAAGRARMIRGLAEAARAAARTVARATAQHRTRALTAISEAIDRHRAAILTANAQDLTAARDAGLAPAMLDRLLLDDQRITGLARAVADIAAAPEIVGRVDRTETRPNGLEIQRVRIPLGVIAMIYEARPNVTTDAAALCLKAGNACILRGGREALESNRALLVAVQDGLTTARLPAETVQLVPVTDREAIAELVRLEDLIDLCIPRGGEGLIRYVAEHARVPVIKHYKGVCHIYVHAGADLELALAIIENAKVQRPGVCNAVETVLVDRAIAKQLIPRLVARLAPAVELRGDDQVRALGGDAVREAIEDDWYAEYLDLILAVRVVDGLEAAIAHIERYGSNHTESILTKDRDVAERFLREVDSSTVMVNASTRFADGGELGLGAEIGISTTRLHAYGPMGAEGLTTTKFVVRGSGQIRS
ncbi:MAG TPA: glutamate-5-semialdehyde dehydrogenase [Kofleriaceae bacterium]|nr:glutamate-5-semialdehyde dehydrogenase [Kofleriaceae bacterium]